MKLFPGIDQAFLEMVRTHTAGDPMRPGVRWTNRSFRQLAKELRSRGFAVSVGVIRQLLRRHRLGRRKVRKSKAMGRHPHRDRQFQIIARLRAEYTQSPSNPILSIDTKKKELIGNFYRAGHFYSTHAVEAFDHDFPGAADGVIIPHGLFDLKRNVGHINIGSSHDTSQFACDSLGYWWRTYGKLSYPNATSILLLCDGGGSNSARRHVFKHALEQLANEIQVEIRVAHYPPYTSKYNPIEHQFFCHVTHACRGVIFTSLEIAMTQIAKTTTETGLRATVHHLAGDYPIGQSAPKNYKENNNIVFDNELPAWNYCAKPTKPGS